jgi:hypothetical protein
LLVWCARIVYFLSKCVAATDWETEGVAINRILLIASIEINIIRINKIMAIRAEIMVIKEAIMATKEAVAMANQATITIIRIKEATMEVVAIIITLEEDMVIETTRIEMEEILEGHLNSLKISLNTRKLNTNLSKNSWLWVIRDPYLEARGYKKRIPPRARVVSLNSLVPRSVGLKV